MDSKDVLFKLIRIALGNEKDFSLPNVVDWGEVYKLAVEQGVAAIAMDGVNAMYEQSAQIQDPGSTIQVSALDALDSPEMDGLKYEWVGYVMNVERGWKKREQLVNMLQVKTVPFYVLKGICFSKYYPIPFHRQGGDIDIIALNNCSEDINKYVESKGVKVDRRIKIHSQFVLNGVLVENHRFLVSDQKLNTELLALMNENQDEFNALYCLGHAKKHFLTEDGVTLRHICDWAMIRSCCVVSDTKLVQFGLKEFEKPFTELAQLLMGELDENGLSNAARLVLRDVLRADAPNEESNSGHSLFARRISMAKTIVGNNWKFKMYNNESMPRYLIKAVWRHFFEKV